MKHQVDQRWRWWSMLVVLFLMAGCAAPTSLTATQSQANTEIEEAAHEDEHEVAETLPTLAPIALEGRKLRVVATTNLVGDAVARVGGDQIELSTLLAPGVDPHAYQLAPADRQLLEDADVIFINGLGLEEGMLPVLDELGGSVPVASVNVGIETIEFGKTHEKEHAEEHEGEEAGHDEEQEGEHHHEGADPHSWQSVPNVIVWTENIAATLRALDPANADAYAASAMEYRTQLEGLNTELNAWVDELPVEQRKIVTDHDSLGYLAHEYGFTVVGTVIPSLSTVASASAQELAALEEQIKAEGVRAIFVGTTVNPQLAEQLAADLGIQVIPIYTDSLSDATGLASTYVDFMRHNVQTIVDALR